MEATFAILTWLVIIGGAVVWTYRAARADRDRQMHEELTAPLAAEVDADEVFWIPRHVHPTQWYMDLAEHQEAEGFPRWTPPAPSPGGRHRVRDEVDIQTWGRTHLRRRIMRHVAQQQHN